ncbi:hypothetical protein [Sporichthya polymorpha]|uniref:hypothetical protein n=1 Tax=Sporichthya polymorpha TaxID=35751 RepID=UPI0003779799|nr:hypothetical protein [Sporichthya polymorpha]
MKTPLGSEANARKARAVARRFPDLPPDHPNHATTMEHEGETWTFLGKGARVAFLGPDGVAYKAHTDDRTETFDHEVATFTRHADKPWCPDWWPYPTQKVMAMKPYAPLTEGTADPGELLALRESWAGEESPENMGLDEDGHLVLIDGGIDPRHDRTAPGHRPPTATKVPTVRCDASGRPRT